jgi:hypothetical protein
VCHPVMLSQGPGWQACCVLVPRSRLSAACRVPDGPRRDWLADWLVGGVWLVLAYPACCASCLLLLGVQLDGMVACGCPPRSLHHAGLWGRAGLYMLRLGCSPLHSAGPAAAPAPPRRTLYPAPPAHNAAASKDTAAGRVRADTPRTNACIPRPCCCAALCPGGW